MLDEDQVILVVDDDLEVAQLVATYLRANGYAVDTVGLGKEALRYALANPPDLVIQDIQLPDIDGFEVAYQMRSDRRTKDIPIIFLTEKRARSDRLQGLELGADDYITKPFDMKELKLRVRNALRRTVHERLTNPVTNLPEGVLVDEQLQECLNSRSWAILLVSLGNLTEFREIYGFVVADDVLRATSLMIHNALGEVGGVSDFVGHFSPDEILVITDSNTQPGLTERIKTRLEQSLDYFYPLEEREPRSQQHNQLEVRLRTLTAEQGPYPSVELLRTRLSAIDELG